MSLSGSEQRDDSRLNWVRTGPVEADTVLLIHPVGYDLTYWGEQIEALESLYDVVAIDLPGHGRSWYGPAASSFSAIAAQVAELIESLGKAAAHVVGISVGGMIAQTVALAYPKQVLSLCLIGTASSFPESVRAGMIARAESVEQGGMALVLQSSLERWFTERTRTRRPDLIERVSRTLLANDPYVHAAMWRMIATFDVTEQLGEIACPTLVLVGDQDPSTPPSVATVLADNIPGAQMAILADTSHIAMLESPAAVNAQLLAFLTRVRRSKPSGK